MITSIILVTLIASGYLSEARITVKDFPPEIPKRKPENMRTPQPFHCTAASEKIKGDKTTEGTSVFTDDCKVSSMSSSQNQPKQETTVSDKLTTNTVAGLSSTVVTPFSRHRETVIEEGSKPQSTTELYSPIRDEEGFSTTVPLNEGQSESSRRTTEPQTTPQQHSSTGDEEGFSTTVPFNEGQSESSSSPTEPQTTSQSYSPIGASETFRTATGELSETSDPANEFSTTNGLHYSSSVPPCSENMEYTNCSCHGTCSYPNICIEDCNGTFGCICPRDKGFLINGSDCVPLQDCGCYINKTNIVVADNESYLTENCSWQWNCNEGHLSRENHDCSDKANCKSENEALSCSCNDGYFGNGQQCKPLDCGNLFNDGYIKACPSSAGSPCSERFCYCNNINSDINCLIPSDCQDIFKAGFRDSGVYTIQPQTRREPFKVYCNITTDIGWTVFQRRVNGSVDFNKNRSMYRDGFGSLNGEFWLGFKQIKYLVRSKTYRLRIDLVSEQNGSYNAEYSKVLLEDGSFRLDDLGNHSGSAGDALECHKGKSFYTNDDGGSTSSKKAQSGGWWRKKKKQNCEQGPSNLNGNYSSQDGDGIIWAEIERITYTEMKLAVNQGEDAI